MAQQPDQQALAATLAAYQAQTQALRASLTSYITRLWAALGSYRAADMAAFVTQAVPVVAGAQLQMAGLTAASLAAQKEAALGGAFTPAAVSPAKVSGAAVRNGTSPQEVYERPFHLVWRQLAELPHEDGAIDQAIRAGLDRAVQSALTDVQLAKTHTAQQILGQDKQVVGYRRVLEGAYSCGLCVIASTQRYHKQDLLPIHPACVPGDASVSGRNVVAVSRRWYAGELTVITTAAGDQIRVTPNHPVLTDQGWLPAGFVREGDRVLRSIGGERLVHGGPDEQHRPALAEDVWRSARMAFGLVQMPLAAEDFHGDGADGEVDVVRTDGGLAAVGDVTFLQPRREPLFVPGGGWRILLPAESRLAALVPPGLPASAGVMCGSGLSGSLCGGHLAGSVEPGRRTATRFDAPRDQFSLESAAVYASRGRDLIGRLAGQIEADRVVEHRRIGFAGHVYNLHTDEGWYSTGSHIVSNCDCAIAPIWGYEPGDTAPAAVNVNGQIIEFASLPDIHQRIKDQFGASSPGAREIPGALDSKDVLKQYRDALISHEHGELGPVLAVRGRPFLGPSDLN